MRLLALAARLLLAQDASTADRLCAEWWLPDLDAQAECVGALESWRADPEGPVADPARPSTWASHRDRK